MCCCCCGLKKNQQEKRPDDFSTPPFGEPTPEEENIMGLYEPLDDDEPVWKSQWMRSINIKTTICKKRVKRGRRGEGN